MIDMTTLQTRIVTGLKHHLQPLGVTAVVERDQNAPAPSHPFVGFKWISITPEPGSLRRTREVVPTEDPRFEHDVQYTYIRNPVMTLSVTVFDRDGTQIHGITQSAHGWFSIPELAGDWLEPTGAVIVEVTPIADRDTVLDEQIERRQGFDARLRVVDILQVTVPTIERVLVTGMGGEIAREIEL